MESQIGPATVVSGLESATLAQLSTRTGVVALQSMGAVGKSVLAVRTEPSESVSEVHDTVAVFVSLELVGAPEYEHV